MGIAMSILETARGAVASHGGGKLEEVRVAVGELSALEPELLRYAWEALVADGPESACRLEIEWRPARQHCPECGTDKPRGPASWLRLCPDCGGPLLVEGGDELDLLNVAFVGYDADPEGEA
jgi:Zn finger protein HypA/HybF involved in hydrogenase expression